MLQCWNSFTFVFIYRFVIKNLPEFNFPYTEPDDFIQHGTDKTPIETQMFPSNSYADFAMQYRFIK